MGVDISAAAATSEEEVASAEGLADPAFRHLGRTHRTMGAPIPDEAGRWVPPFGQPERLVVNKISSDQQG